MYSVWLTLHKDWQHGKQGKNFAIKFHTCMTLIHKTCQKGIELLMGCHFFFWEIEGKKTSIETLKWLSIHSHSSHVFVTILDISDILVKEANIMFIMLMQYQTKPTLAILTNFISSLSNQTIILFSDSRIFNNICRCTCLNFKLYSMKLKILEKFQCELKMKMIHK